MTVKNSVRTNFQKRQMTRLQKKNYIRIVNGTKARLTILFRQNKISFEKYLKKNKMEKPIKKTKQTRVKKISKVNQIKSRLFKRKK